MRQCIEGGYIAVLPQLISLPSQGPWILDILLEQMGTNFCRESTQEMASNKKPRLMILWKQV